MRRIGIVLAFALALVASSACGKSPTAPTDQAVISSFTADSLTLTAGVATSLHWTVTGKDVHSTITPALGDVPATGSATVAPAVTTTYTLTVTQAGYQIARSLTIAVK